MKINEAITFIADDEKVLQKMLIGALVSSIPILNFAWFGYITEIIDNVSKKAATPLPEWGDLGGKFMKGLRLVLAGFVYSLPAILLGGVPLIILVVGGLASGEDMGDAFVAAATGTGLLLLCCISLYLLALSFFLPAMNINFARQDTFRSCFQIKEILAIVSRRTGDYLIAWIVSILFAILIGISAGLLSVVADIIPCIGWILAWVITALVSVWSTIVYAHLFGQVSAAASAS